MPNSFRAPTRRAAGARLLAPLALAALLAGYADLARGGVTAGPVLLVVAYVALVPAALLRA